MAKYDNLRSECFIYDDSTVTIGCTATESTTWRTDGRYTVYNYGEISSRFDKPYYFAQHFEKRFASLTRKYSVIFWFVGQVPYLYVIYIL